MAMKCGIEVSNSGEMEPESNAAIPGERRVSRGFIKNHDSDRNKICKIATYGFKRLAFTGNR